MMRLLKGELVCVVGSVVVYWTDPVQGITTEDEDPAYLYWWLCSANIVSRASTSHETAT